MVKICHGFLILWKKNPETILYGMEHFNNKLKEFIKLKDDWDEEDKLLERLNKEVQNNFESNLLNFESIIEAMFSSFSKASKK